MIVSRSHNFIFVHIFKTAGTSIKRVLRRYDMPAWQEPVNSVLKRIGIAQYGPRDFPDHLTATALVQQTSLEEFQSYFSFAFVRNPWDWELSHYKYILRSKRHMYHERVSSLKDFSEYVRWRCDGRARKQSGFTDHQGEQIVSFVGRYERLVDDFDFVCQQIGIERRLPKLNSTSKTVYQHHYNDHTRELIEQTYRSDIERFGYSFAQDAELIVA